MRWPRGGGPRRNAPTGRPERAGSAAAGGPSPAASLGRRRNAGGNGTG
ncbi:hypothetical protein ISF6_1898 [Piscinibacter sakaiensis]|uniref:Uncharacterized protein n=1 Tax=Piscinibacter sakaiensis TaxID=1547922 RepID=A0A0K8P0A0_PISS1|nr:hypothetical protein ISF6_1898 [Piscinibacter sakaiensis]